MKLANFALITFFTTCIVNASEATFDADGAYKYRSYAPLMDMTLLIKGNGAHLIESSSTGIRETDFEVEYPEGKKYLYLNDAQGQHFASFAEAKPMYHAVLSSGWGKMPNVIGQGLWSKGVVVGQAEDCCGENGPKDGVYEATGYNLDHFVLKIGKEGNGSMIWSSADREKFVIFEGRRKGSSLIWTEVYTENNVRKYGQTLAFDGTDPKKLVCIDCSLQGRKIPQTWVYQQSFAN